MASMRIHLGTPVAIELRDVVMANMAGGSEPWMLKIAHRLDAETTPLSLLRWSLFGGAPVVSRLSVDGLQLLLEHGPKDSPNRHQD